MIAAPPTLREVYLAIMQGGIPKERYRMLDRACTWADAAAEVAGCGTGNDFEGWAHLSDKLRAARAAACLVLYGF